MVCVPENKPEGEPYADAFGAVGHCTPCSAKLLSLVMSCTEILAFLSKYDLHGKNLLQRHSLMLMTIAVAAWATGLCTSTPAQMLLIGPGTVCIGPDTCAAWCLTKELP